MKVKVFLCCKKVFDKVELEIEAGGTVIGDYIGCSGKLYACVRSVWF